MPLLWPQQYTGPSTWQLAICSNERFAVLWQKEVLCVHLYKGGEGAEVKWKGRESFILPTTPFFSSRCAPHRRAVGRASGVTVGGKKVIFPSPCFYFINQPEFRLPCSNQVTLLGAVYKQRHKNTKTDRDLQRSGREFSLFLIMGSNHLISKRSAIIFAAQQTEQRPW